MLDPNNDREYTASAYTTMANMSVSAENLPATAITIDLIPDGDIILVLGNLDGHPHASYIARVLNEFRQPGAPEIEPDGLPDEIHVRVLTAMLRAVSEGFRVMLRPDGIFDRLADGSRVYRDDEDPGFPMLMLLLVIFGRPSLVPERLLSSELVDVCKLIDKYLLREAVKLQTDAWALGFSSTGPLSYSDKYTTSQSFEEDLFVGNFLRVRSLFRPALQGYIVYGKVPLVMDDLPFPDLLLDKINNSRSQVIALLGEKLSNLIKLYAEKRNTPLCEEGKFDCDWMAYGSLHMRLLQSPVFTDESSSTPISPDIMQANSLKRCLEEVQNLGVATVCAAAKSPQAQRGREIHGKIAAIIQDVQIAANASIDGDSGILASW